MSIADQINALLAAVSDERDTILADDQGSYSPGQALSLAVSAEYLHQTSQPPLKPMPKALQGPKGLHCADCTENWREVMTEAWKADQTWLSRMNCPAYQERLYREEQGCYDC